MEDKLKKLGLTDYETKAYLALISSGSVGGNKLSEVSKVPQGKIYLILSKLIEKGLVSQVNSKPKIFKAIDPEISLKALINEQKNNLDEIAQSVSAGIKEIKKLELNKQETDEKITILRGKKNTFPIAHYLYENAKKSLDVMLTFELLTATSERLLLEAKEKGIKIRILATKKDNLQLIKNMKKQGFNIKYYPVDELRILIKDNEECIEMIVNPHNLMDRTNIYIQSKELTNALKIYFDSVWKKAESI